jgi:hypothetical protein
MAVTSSVFVDAVERVLYARLADDASSYERMAWADAWLALRKAENLGWPPSAGAWPMADLPGNRQAVHGRAADGAQLAFRCPPGTSGFAALIGPGAYAIVVLDRGTHRFLSAKFLSRSSAA